MELGAMIFVNKMEISWCRLDERQKSGENLSLARMRNTSGIRRASSRRWSKALPIILVFFLSACSQSGGQPDNTPPTLSPADVKVTVRALDTDADGTIMFQGVIVENNYRCEVDAQCVLRINVDGTEFNTVYHYGEWPPCANSEASEQGFRMVAGDRVEVHAGITDDGDLSTCDDKEFYIRKIDSD
jgi:hypothetical protein